MPRHAISEFIEAEDGALTQFALFWLILFLAVGSLALDVSNGYRERTQMQDATDAAALGAIYLASNPTVTVEEASQKAAELAQANLRADDGATVITTDDVTFGYYDAKKNEFTTDFSLSDDLTRAVKVTARRSADRKNEAPSFFAHVIGQDGWAIQTSAVAESYRPACMQEGLSAEGVIDLQSGNTFASGFCLYAADYVSLNQNNTFEDGSIVSMPDLSKLDIPASGFKQNTGLQESLRTAFYKLHVIDRISSVIEGLKDGTSYIPDYIFDKTVYPMSGSKLDVTDFVPGHMYELACNNKSVTISPLKASDKKADGLDPSVSLDTMRNVIVFSSCPVQFGNGTALENVIFTNTSTDDKSFSAPQGLRLGANDNCASGGGAQLITMGGVGSAAKMEFYGGQIIAARDVSFSAQASGIQGIAIVAGGKIDGTSNSTFGHCGSGMEDNIEVSYFRLRM